MGDRARKEAWVTLATNDSYALGCLVLGYSLRRVQTTRQLVVMHTEGVSEAIKGQLQTVFDRLVEVTVLDSEDARNLSLLGRPDLNVTYTKIHCWELTDFEKAVFLDADTLVLQNSDELFDREELSAAPDAGWPDCFNSGVFVYCPSLETYQRLINFAQTTGSFDGGDQGLLNSFYNTWSTEDISKHLPFIYNVVSQAFYSYLPAFTQFREKIKIVHFIGPIKPWHHPFNTATKTVTTMPETGHSQEFLQIWWDLFMDLVQPKLDPTLVGSRATLSWPGMGIGCCTLLQLVEYPEKEVKAQSCPFCELFFSLKYMNKATMNTPRKRCRAQCCPFCELFFSLKYMNKATMNTLRKRSKHDVVSSVSCFSP